MKRDHKIFRSWGNYIYFIILQHDIKTIYLKKINHNIEFMLPTLIVVFSILTGATMLMKIFLSLKFLNIKNQPRNFIVLFLMSLASIFMIWFPFLFDAENERLIHLKKKINLLTYIFYTLFFLLMIVVFLQIQNIRNR